MDVYRILPELKGNREIDTENFECVVRNLSQLDRRYFLQNTLKHWHETQGNVQNRSVLYLFVNATGDQALGLAIRWLNPETTLASQLWRDHGITDDQPRKTGRYLKNPIPDGGYPASVCGDGSPGLERHSAGRDSPGVMRRAFTSRLPLSKNVHDGAL